MSGFNGTIVYVGTFEMPDKNALAHRVLNNAKILGMLGYQTVFCGISKESNQSIEIMKPFMNAPLADEKASIHPYRHFRHIKNVIENVNNVKFIITSDTHTIMLAMLIRYCRKKNIKLIADITEWFSYKLSFNPETTIRFLDTFFVMRVLHKKVDGIIAISTYLEEYYKPYVKNIVVIPPLVDVTEDLWSDLNTPREPYLRFVYTGIPGKGTSKDCLAQIIQYFSEIVTDVPYKFIIAGVTKEQFLKNNPNYCYEHALSILGERVCFIGKISHKESINELKQSDFSIILRERSRRNMAGFPTKFVECVTCGVGIIANNFSDIAKYFPSDDQSILLEDNSARCFKRHLSIILKETNINKKSHSMRTVFHYKNWVKKMEELLSNLYD